MTSLPCINVHDATASARAERELQDLNLAAGGRISVSEVFKNAFLRIKDRLNGGEVLASMFITAPVFAYMPYISVWETSFLGSIDFSAISEFVNL